MKIFYILLITLFTLTITSCNKETATTQTSLMNTMLNNKKWYLDYSVTGTSTKSYVGQPTFMMTYYKDGRIEDSDGLKGTYSVELINNQSQIHMQVKTANGNSLEVVYNIISVGETRMVLSKQVQSVTPTALYFSTK